MTITEFLLARIAEDEAVATRYHRVLCMRTACDCLWGEDEEDLKEQERVCTCGYPARVLAECEAKRRLVGDEWSEDPETLRILASVYADHPDYRQEWRP